MRTGQDEGSADAAVPVSAPCCPLGHGAPADQELGPWLAHEIRTPLTAVLGYLEMTLDGTLGELSEPQRHALDCASGAAQRLAGLAQHLGHLPLDG